jgi:ribosomal protein L7/L12
MNAPRLNISDDVLDEVLSCLGQGRKLEAVKILRGAAGVSLMEAKQLVDQLEAEQRAQTIPALPPSTSTEAGNDWRIAGKLLLRDGKKLEAIRLCMQQTGLSLAIAKEKVDELAAREGIPHRSLGCVPMLILVLVVAAAIGVGIAWAIR